MRDNLIAYINQLFRNAATSARLLELRDELMQNTLDRYDDELAAGKSEQDAYNAAVESIGDIEPLVGPLRKPTPLGQARRAVAIVLYVLCVLPVIICGLFGSFWPEVGVCLMFLLAAVATWLLLLGEKRGDKRKNLRALGIGLYIFCVTPTIFFDALLQNELGDVLGVSGMFVIAAAATALLIFSCSLPKPKTVPAVPTTAPEAATVKKPEKVKPFYTKSLAYRIGVPVYWVFVVCLFGLAMTFGGWYYAWLLFPAAGALYDIVIGLVLSAKGYCGGRKTASGFLWLVMLVGYLLLTVQTGDWMYTWLVFPIAALLSSVIGGIFDLVKGENSYEK